MANTTLAEKPKQKPRRYDQGPLSISEFNTDSPQAVRGRAFTMARIMYEYKTIEKRLNANRYQVELKSLDTYSIFDRENSWWGHRPSQALLDHEQGHFDIAEIASRRIDLAMRKAIKQRKTIRGLGRNLRRAREDFESKLRQAIDLAQKQAEEENADYDEQTMHGIRTSRQSEYRRIQKLTLEKLARELSPKKSKARPDPAGVGRSAPTR